MNEVRTITLIVEDELDLNDLLKQIVSSSDGAVAMFTGLVRGVTRREDPHETEDLEYEAYQPMAEAMMKRAADEIRSQWSTIEGIAIVQRIGRLYPCTPTVSRMEDGEGFIVIDHSRLVVALVRPRDLRRLEHFAQLTQHLARAPGQYTKLLAGLQPGQVHPAVAAFGL